MDKQPDQADIAASFQNIEVVNPFPMPPDRFSLFTDKNLELLALLRQQSKTGIWEPLPEGMSQNDILTDQASEGIPDWPLTTLEKPRLDWIIERAVYHNYGKTWEIIQGQPVPSGDPGALFLADPTEDQRPHLLRLLKTLLHSYYTILGRATEYPLVDTQAEPLHSAELTYVTDVAMGLMDAVNDFRPLQARENLEQLLAKQLRDRREETAAINDKCDVFEATLATLREQARHGAARESHEDKAMGDAESTLQTVPQGGVLDWAASLE